jgi:VanZ family protein
LVRLPLYRPVLLALRVALGILLAALVLLGDVTATLIVAVFLALSFAHLLRSDRRPAVFDVLFALAALAGAIGYAFGLFDEIVPYDELTHAFTTFSVSLAFHFLFYGGAVPERRAVALATSVFTLGVTVGAYWEIFEWFFVGKFTMADTISDLLVDSLGALAAALVALALRRSGDRLT